MRGEAEMFPMRRELKGVSGALVAHAFVAEAEMFPMRRELKGRNIWACCPGGRRGSRDVPDEEGTERRIDG